jgi:hypothetical protein
MLERFELVLKITCLALAALLVWQIGRIMVRRDPLAHLNIPAQPSLPASLNAQTDVKGTNSAPRSPGKPTTNAVSSQDLGKGTNAVASQNLRKGTNAVSLANPAGTGMNLAMRPGPGRKGPDLPPAIQSRVDRITDSELLGPVIRPLPMALLGIAGDVAFLRAPNGETGMPKEGDELGGIKLLRIGTNRVLIEEEGQKKELLIFSGFGGESLLPKPKDNPQ